MLKLTIKSTINVNNHYMIGRSYYCQWNDMHNLLHIIWLIPSKATCSLLQARHIFKYLASWFSIRFKSTHKRTADRLLNINSLMYVSHPPVSGIFFHYIRKKLILIIHHNQSKKELISVFRKKVRSSNLQSQHNINPLINKYSVAFI